MVWDYVQCTVEISDALEFQFEVWGRFESWQILASEVRIVDTVEFTVACLLLLLGQEQRGVLSELDLRGCQLLDCAELCGFCDLTIKADHRVLGGIMLF